ncbi:unnamed protein product [Nezara viridula]|uniref:Uncharacterized protein n=1 Tax=Nezara viridula TaxID=85310 RepID=A0A9P0DZP7_NEZVI|nr:unnamed protein product [Nezara viridula]
MSTTRSRSTSVGMEAMALTVFTPTLPSISSSLIPSNSLIPSSSLAPPLLLFHPALPLYPSFLSHPTLRHPYSLLFLIPSLILLSGLHGPLLLHLYHQQSN